MITSHIQNLLLPFNTFGIWFYLFGKTLEVGIDLFWLFRKPLIYIFFPLLKNKLFFFLHQSFYSKKILQSVSFVFEAWTWMYRERDLLTYQTIHCPWPFSIVSWSYFPFMGVFLSFIFIIRILVERLKNVTNDRKHSETFRNGQKTF